MEEKQVVLRELMLAHKEYQGSLGIYTSPDGGATLSGAAAEKLERAIEKARRIWTPIIPPYLSGGGYCQTCKTYGSCEHR